MRCRQAEEGKRPNRGNTEIIFFGRCLLDRVPIKLDTFSGIGREKLVEI